MKELGVILYIIGFLALGFGFTAFVLTLVVIQTRKYLEVKKANGWYYTIFKLPQTKINREDIDYIDYVDGFIGTYLFLNAFNTIKYFFSGYRIVNDRNGRSYLSVSMSEEYLILDPLKRILIKTNPPVFIPFSTIINITEIKFDTIIMIQF